MSDATVLIIEDNPDTLEAVRLILQHEGFTALAASDCSIAFDHIGRRRPDVILTDLTLPKITGLEFIQLEFIQMVRAMGGCQDIPIIAMSAFDDSYLMAAVKAGANATLHKPEGLEYLIDTVKNVLHGLSPALTRTQQTGVDLNLSSERLTPAVNK